MENDAAGAGSGTGFGARLRINQKVHFGAWHQMNFFRQLIDF
jgi:hypothetical protein